MAIPSCPGWGLQKWSDDPWGGDDVSAPVVASIIPACGSTDISTTTPIIIKVCNPGCSGLGIDCIRIYINGDLIYDGTGLTLVDLIDGFAAPCAEACSAVTYSTDPVTGEFCFTFNICCTPFPCDSTVTIAATFCNTDGDIVSIEDCTFTTRQCNLIESVEIIDSQHIVVRFSNRMLPNPVINRALYDAEAWNVMAVSGAFVTGKNVHVNRVLVEKSFLPKTVILETTPMTSGSMYEIVGDPAILDIYRQPLINAGKSVLIGRNTKVDVILGKLPRMYKQLLNNPVEDNHKLISLWQILAAIGIEDERISGDY